MTNPKGERPKHLFQKGAPKHKLTGRKKGVQNKVSYEVKKAILEAAAMVGNDGKGKDGLLGYLAKVARTSPKVYCRLIEKLIPLQIKVDEESLKITRYETLEELQIALAARGLPPTMIDVTPPKIPAPAAAPYTNGKGNGADI